jgi:hypothetical protein
MIPTIQIKRLTAGEALAYIDTAPPAVQAELLGEMAATILDRQIKAEELTLNWQYLSFPDLLSVYRTLWSMVEEARRGAPLRKKGGSTS